MVAAFWPFGTGGRPSLLRGLQDCMARTAINLAFRRGRSSQQSVDRVLDAASPDRSAKPLLRVITVVITMALCACCAGAGGHSQ